jgi:uncharacterized protein YdeI (YjbR/CyaY-like superfamily)
MSKKDPRIDLYIAKAQPFAQPILIHIRELVHKVCPDVEEKMKWSFPHFDYKGEMMCSMAAFKAHAVMGFWKAALMSDPVLSETAASESAMGHMGKLTSLKDLPSDKKLTGYIREAMKLNDDGVKLPPRKAVSEVKKQDLKTPSYLVTALKKNKKAKEAFDNFPYSHRKEYIEWFEDAKTDATRERRLEQGLEWMAEGKSRNWKYMRK